jgi:hypothetical protein
MGYLNGRTGTERVGERNGGAPRRRQVVNAATTTTAAMDEIASRRSPFAGQ